MRLAHRDWTGHIADSKGVFLSSKIDSYMRISSSFQRGLLVIPKSWDILVKRGSIGPGGFQLIS